MRARNAIQRHSAERQITDSEAGNFHIISTLVL